MPDPADDPTLPPDTDAQPPATFSDGVDAGDTTDIDLSTLDVTTSSGLQVSSTYYNSPNYVYDANFLPIDDSAGPLSDPDSSQWSASLTHWPFFSQLAVDKGRDRNKMSNCGPTCLSMQLAWVLGHYYSPEYLLEGCYGSTYSGGTGAVLFDYWYKRLGFPKAVQAHIQTTSQTSLVAYLKKQLTSGYSTVCDVQRWWWYKLAYGYHEPASFKKDGHVVVCIGSFWNTSDSSKPLHQRYFEFADPGTGQMATISTSNMWIVTSKEHPPMTFPTKPKPTTTQAFAFGQTLRRGYHAGV
jgi:hypothetical protein